MTIVTGDCVAAMAGMPAASVDAICTDPPYLLSFMGRAWDHAPTPLQGQAMHQRWAYEALRVLKPGGHLLAFGGTRTYHRLACAIEDAGFEIRDTLAWMYGAGFPKSLDVGKAIGKRNLSAPATPDAEQWNGWGTALKPGHEPIVCARKPFSPVPCGDDLSHIHHGLAALLWLALSPAKRAAMSSPSSHHEQHAAWCVSARASAATDTSPAGYEPTDTYSSPALASTCSSIASSWSAILAGLSAPMTTSTTATGSSTTTGLRTLSSLLAPLTSPTTMPPCECLHDGRRSGASSAAETSSAEWAKWLDTLSTSVPASAIEGLALAAASVLASVAAESSGALEAASSVPSPALTGPPTTSDGSRPLSPAHEPIVLARKPLTGTVAGNVLTHGTGALNIDACRIDFVGDADRESAKPDGAATAKIGALAGGSQHDGERSEFEAVQGSGRWPANVLLDPEAAAILDEQTGESISRVGKPRGAAAGDGWGMTATGAEYDDTGGASRFYGVFNHEEDPWTSHANNADNPSSPNDEALDSADASARPAQPPEREDNTRPSNGHANNAATDSSTTPATGPDATAPTNARTPAVATRIPTANDAEPSAKSTTTGSARTPAPTHPADTASLHGPGSTPEHSRPTPYRFRASTAAPRDGTATMSSTNGPRMSCGCAPAVTPLVIPIDGTADESDLTRWKYQGKASTAERNAGLNGFANQRVNRYNAKGQGPLPQQTPTEGVIERNIHPTVKPIDLMRWLVRLITPPGGHILDPFTGSGTTGIAAHLEGLQFTGIEREPEYADIARARINWWTQRDTGTTSAILEALDAVDPDQLELDIGAAA